ncbi:MAG: ABC transporter ATP-binding protein [Firmicutes bacterium]|nr:ABC transporter ATP-binding protein [Bacillota bacterium]
MVELNSVGKVYRSGKVEVHALREISLRVGSGEFVSIMGPSGSGKSTLLNIVGCLDRPSSGSFRIGGTAVDRLGDGQLADLRNKCLGFVFQGFHLLPRLTARQNVEMPLVYRGVVPRQRREKAEAMLAAVGLANETGRLPTELSGGQQQRVAIARALVGEPVIVLADEPTGNLDSNTGREIMILLQNLNSERGVTIVQVTHDQAMVAYGRRVIRLKDGYVVDDSPA